MVHWDSPEKSKQRLDAVRRNIAKKKAVRVAIAKAANVIPFRRKPRQNDR
ncbi:MAG TPA: hypothetical protein VFG91_01470 [Woeseiaceae bacterium]|nr:hypothetical protein [Woeseiaceae bacterium]